MSSKNWVRAGILLAVLLLSGCSATQTGQPDGRLAVVTTVSPITNIVFNIGGERIRLTGLVPEGVNSHTFEPAPSAAREIARADLIFVNGLNLEEPTLRLAAANLKEGAEIIRLAEQTIGPEDYVFDFSFPRSAGSPNPHIWLNPIHAARYAEIVHQALVRRDPENADYYSVNLAAFSGRLEALDRAIAAAVQSVPPKNRVLLTYHDSWAYFAPRYGIQVIGAIQPADFSEPSAAEVAALITQIRKEEVPAVFGSEVFPSPVLEQIAREAGAEYHADLRDDDLPGNPGDRGHSYLAMMVENARVIVSALGGDPAPLIAVQTGNIPGPDGSVRQEH